MSKNYDCKWSESDDKVGTPEEITKAVHYFLDWIRACEARPDDNREADTLGILKKCQEGLELTKNFDEHYTGN